MGRVIKEKDLKSKPTGISEEAKEAVKILAEARQAALNMREEAKNDLIDLAVYMAKKIVGRSVESNPRALEHVFKEAIRAASDLDKAVVVVNPEDRRGFDIDGPARRVGFDVAVDASLDRGGCTIKAGGAEVDASLGSVFEVFTKAMKGQDFGRG